MEKEFYIPSDINQNKTIIPEVGQTEEISIALYVGLGAGEKGIENIKRNISQVMKIQPVELSSENIVTEDLSKFDVIIFPGGRAPKQAIGLGEEGKEKIRSFIKEGGGYLGVCAGMYLATVRFEWSLGILNAETKVKNDEWRRGQGFVDIELTKEGKEIFKNSEERFKCRYNNGPIIQPANKTDLPAFTTIAYFRSEISENATPEGIMINTPAAVSAMYGKGKVFAVATHAENTPGLENFIPTVLEWLVKK